MRPPGSTFDSDTLEPDSMPVRKSAPRLPVLVVAWHRDLARVGDRAVLATLARTPVVLSRNEPDFTDASGKTTGPLADAHVSRAPITLRGDAGGGCVIEVPDGYTPVEIAGRTVGARHAIDATAIDAGVVITLPRAAILVLRRAMPVSIERASHGLVGTSDAMTELRRAIDVAATHDDPVLLLGETGTGKELAAAAIHRASERARGPFVAVNMAALHPSTAASELFGHSRGAFTGADAPHAGVFGRADGGTLLLDEIGETPDVVQAMLLRALETGEIDPVGGRSSRRVSVRVIAATDRDLGNALEDGRFRAPLLHRLAAHTITLPPLRARVEDVMPTFLHLLAVVRTAIDTRLVSFDRARELLVHDWPGNVRELRNVAHRLAREGELGSLEAPHATGATRRAIAFDEPAVVIEPSDREVDAPAPKSAHALTDADIERALRDNGFRIGQTARALGIARNTLYKRMERCAGLRRARDLDARTIGRSLAAVDGSIDRAAEVLEVSPRALRLRMRELGLDVDRT